MPSPPPASGSVIETALARATGARRGEIRATLLGAMLFFTIMLAYFLVRPVRDQLSLRGDPDKLERFLAYLYSGTAVATALLHPLIAWAVGRLPRRLFVPGVYLTIAASLAVFAALVMGGGELSLEVIFVFFVWISAFNVIATSTFWSVMVDRFSAAQIKRVVGALAVGGTAGAVVGSFVAGRLAEPFGAGVLITLSAALFLVVIPAFFAFVRAPLAADTPAIRKTDEAGPEESGAPTGGRPWSGVTIFLRSPYLLAVALYLILHTFTGTFVWFEQKNIVAVAVTGELAQTALFADIEFVVQTLTLVVQIFLTGRLIRWMGLGWALAALPLITIAGFAALGGTLSANGVTMAALGESAAAAALPVIIGFDVVRRASNFAIAKPAREALFSVVSREAKYKSKSFIDTFIYRGGDLLTAWTFRYLREVVSLASLAYIAVPIAFGWAALSVWLGGAHARRAKRFDALHKL